MTCVLVFPTDRAVLLSSYAGPATTDMVAMAADVIHHTNNDDVSLELTEPSHSHGLKRPLKAAYILTVIVNLALQVLSIRLVCAADFLSGSQTGTLI